MKRRLCFRITAKLGNLKRQHCSWQEKKKKYIYIYIYMKVRVHCSKKPAKKKKKERQKGQGSLLFAYELQKCFICSGD